MEILTLPAARAEDLLGVRSASRVIAALCGLDEPDQVRLATALSEVGREILAGGGCPEVTFALSAGGSGAIRISFQASGRASQLANSPGVVAARRLVDEVQVAGDTQPAVVEVVKRIPARATTPSIETLARAVRAEVPPSPLEELWAQNRTLADAFAELQVRQQETVRLNAELEETNRGVMAMYGQLADELEETNRGVVALYAELDEKSVQLDEASRAKSRFFTAVSHELRSPVNSILGLARLLDDPADQPLSTEQHHQVGLITSAASDLLELVNQLLDIAKAEAGRLEASLAIVDLQEVADELRGSLRPLVVGGPVDLDVEVGPEVPEIETDRALLAQILRNFLVNAVRFTEKGEVRLRVRSAEGGQHVIFEVEDTGIGIAPEHLGSIFEEFFQVRGPLQARQGTGLGLAHSKRLVAVLEGELTVRSEVGVGSTFTVQLPVHWPKLPSVGTEVLTPKDRLGTVLVVDDDEAFRTVLRGMLQGLAHQVVEADGGGAAIEMMSVAVPDLVFLDLRMPDIDGAGVLEWMGARPDVRDVPVVLVTSVDLGVALPPALARARRFLAKSEVTRDGLEQLLSEITMDGRS